MSNREDALNYTDRSVCREGHDLPIRMKVRVKSWDVVTEREERRDCTVTMGEDKRFRVVER